MSYDPTTPCAAHMVTGCEACHPSPADVREAFPEWEITQSLDGYWQAVLTTGNPGEPRPRLTDTTLAGLASQLNDHLGG